MPVDYRPTTRVVRHVINRQTGNHLLCCWYECEKYGVSIYRWRPPGPNQPTFVFCSDRHRLYFQNSHRENLMLPAGHKRTL